MPINHFRQIFLQSVRLWLNSFRAEASCHTGSSIRSDSSTRPEFGETLSTFANSGEHILTFFVNPWGTFYLFIANLFATQIIGGSKELVACGHFVIKRRNLI